MSLTAQDRIDAIEVAEHLLHPVMEAVSDRIWIQEAKDSIQVLEAFPRCVRCQRLLNQLQARVRFGGPLKYRLALSGAGKVVA